MANFQKGQTDTILPTPDFKPLNMLELRASEFELVPNRFLIPMLQYAVPDLLGSPITSLYIPQTHITVAHAHFHALFSCFKSL